MNCKPTPPSGSLFETGWVELQPPGCLRPVRVVRKAVAELSRSTSHSLEVTGWLVLEVTVTGR